MQELEPRQISSAAVVIEKEGRFFVYQPDLALIASGDNIEAAYGKFCEARRAYLQDFETAGIGFASTAPAVATPTSERLVSGRGVVGELGIFLAKFCIVLVVICGLGAVAGTAVTRSIEGLKPEIARATSGVSDVVSSLSSISMVDIANKAAVIVQDVQAMPAERKESLRQSIGILSREIAPIADAWRDPSSSAAPSTAPSVPPKP